MEKDYKDFEIIVGNKLKEARIEKGISQEDLSINSGLDRSYISMLERGKRNPTLLVIFKLCQTLDISPNLLIKNIEDAL
ncbi:helix-turn-helix domain-containing protein [Arachidicoccus terrestris]|uniref:helix-turn-helix domain-containing protein n=1 Tax=Arachidicoccus terrestris TaxID=2875539 RepID=UPI001CC4DA6A|nr:helix-turn-helix transcriptional regulator [Arachidicoccus terrestris]UAY55693.1 helix-turn-helix domain-containing protein [Arachidicoccus terrestris]